AALRPDHNGRTAAVARAHLVGCAASLPPDSAVADPSGLTAAVCWHSPLVLAGHPDAGRFIAAAWQEARLLGVVAHHALTPLGRALLGSAEDLAAACRSLLPEAEEELIFQPDLTTLAPGSPARALAALPDAAADREHSGQAVICLFTPCWC